MKKLLNICTLALLISSIGGLIFGNQVLAEGIKEGRLEGRLKAKSKTTIDFNETLIVGKMKAPQGFFIQGRQAQVLVQLIKLRSEFRRQLKQSKFSVRHIVR